MAVVLLVAPSLFAGVSLPTAGHLATAEVPYYPSAASGAAMVYDPVDHYVVLFGGSSGTNDTWVLSGGRWTELPESIAPAARIGACATWDTAAGYLVLFGGELVAAGLPLVNDTWEFVHGKWSEFHPSLSPPPLAWASCTYDPTAGSIVMFGGTSPTNATTAATWTFQGGQWTLQPVRESPRPIPPRFGAAMLFWSPGGYVDLYGGQGNTSSLNDSWEWIEGGWQEINSGQAPSGRVLPSVAANTTSHVGVLFGGAVSANGSTSNSTWALGTSGRWSRTPTVSAPSARFEAAFAYDGADQCFVLFGGSSSTTMLAPSLNDTWTYSGVNWTNITASADRPPPPAAVSPAPEPAFLEYLVVGIAIAILIAVMLVLLLKRRGDRGSRSDSASPPDSDGSR